MHESSLFCYSAIQRSQSSFIFADNTEERLSLSLFYKSLMTKSPTWRRSTQTLNHRWFKSVVQASSASASMFQILALKQDKYCYCFNNYSICIHTETLHLKQHHARLQDFAIWCPDSYYSCKYGRLYFAFVTITLLSSRASVMSTEAAGPRSAVPGLKTSPSWCSEPPVWSRQSQLAARLTEVTC